LKYEYLRFTYNQHLNHCNIFFFFLKENRGILRILIEFYEKFEQKVEIEI
jgi:hypothetical protein